MKIPTSPMRILKFFFPKKAIIGPAIINTTKKIAKRYGYD
jgi:hypothetical protein